MPALCLLQTPQNYIADDHDLIADETARLHWLDLFDRHFDDTMRHAIERYGDCVKGNTVAARASFTITLGKVAKNPASLPSGQLNVMEFCRLREFALRSHDLPDPFGHIKDRENNIACELYPQIIRGLDQMAGEALWLQLIKGVFAGNLFDLGSPATMHHASESPDFLSAVQNVKPRPWFVDNFDLLYAHIDSQESSPRWTKAIVFVDNAGSDFILGVLPLVRQMAIGGTRIVLAANELPTLNDLTADETRGILTRLSETDETLARFLSEGAISVVSSGNDIPLIDFSRISQELNLQARDADLIIIEGMGRAVESNFDARFTVDCLQLALIKDTNVGDRFGAKIFDPVCKYRPIAKN